MAEQPSGPNGAGRSPGLAESATKAVVVGAAAYGAADAIGLPSDKAAVVGAAAAAFNGVADAAVAARRRMRGISARELQWRMEAQLLLSGLKEELETEDEVAELKDLIGEVETLRDDAKKFAYDDLSDVLSRLYAHLVRIRYFHKFEEDKRQAASAAAEAVKLLGSENFSSKHTFTVQKRSRLRRFLRI